MGKILTRSAAAAFAAILAISIVGNGFAQTAQPAAATQPMQATQSNQPVTAADATQVPQPDSGVNWPGAGYGAAALVGNAVYIPAKLVYAVVGGLIGGGTWLVTAGNTQAANTVWRSSLGGDYVLTPQMVAGQQPINFSGPTNTPPPAASSPDNTSSSSVQPITPIVPAASAPAAAAAPAQGPSASNAGGSHPMDAGSGPVNSSGGAPGGTIE
ncbi:MAG: hypothetical protein ACLQAT_29820 [Candidatus Binataceae bacterium]